MTTGQLWLTRRIGHVIESVEQAVDQINPHDYDVFEHFLVDVYDEVLSKTFDGSATESHSDSFNDRYLSVFSALKDTFDDQLKEYFYSVNPVETINENFDRILDLYSKKKEGVELRPSEQTMMRAFQKFVNQGGNAEEFVYSDEEDYDVDDREGETFEYDGFEMPLVYTFSEEFEENGEINYFGEIKFEDDEFLGVITTDKRGFVIDYDFYSVLEDDVRLQDILKDLQIEDEVMNFFAEEVIPSLRNLSEGFINESDLPVNNIEKLKKHWRNQLKQGKQIRFDNEELEFWGINQRVPKRYAQIAFQELVGDEKFALKFIKTLLNKTFSTKDFSDKIVGGYDFEWVITEVQYKDFDFYLYGTTLPGGTVELMNGRNLSLDEAVVDEDLGWEIQSEIDEVTQDCMNEIILPVTGYNVDVSLIVK